MAATVCASALAGQPSYQKWLDEDVSYIITDGEREAFQHLTIDAQREQFIQQFWSRRNTAPGRAENPFQEEHYRRIAYANEHFAAGIPGWETDRGRVYIVLGPPDEIESYSVNPPPKERWQYSYVNRVGYIELEFADPTLTGEYRLSLDPAEQEALLSPRPEAGGVRYSVKCPIPTIVVTGAIGDVKISLPIPSTAPVTIYARVADPTNRRAVQVFEETLREPGPVYQTDLLLPLGSYRLTLVVRDASGNAVESECPLEVK